MCLQAVESHLRPVLQTLAHEVDPNSKVDVAHFLAGKQTRCKSPTACEVAQRNGQLEHRNARQLC